MQIAVVIPVYNESATIRDVATAVLQQTENVIIVDDGSSDDSQSQLEGLNVHLLRHEQNQGKATALQSGFDHAIKLNAQMIITLDGDGQHNPAEIPRLISAAQANPNSIIIAARLKQRHNAPKLRLFANRFADFWVSWAAGYPVTDSQSGFRLYPFELVRDVRLNTSKEKGFVFESEIVIEAARHSFYSVSVPVESIYHVGRRQSHYKPWTDTWRIVRMIAWRLIKRGLYLQGLFRSLGIMADPRKQAAQ
ncbi:MAG: glycosyltransferase family 2 protein [Candidatus Thiodiazotropha sp. (ex. Lucinisca nassula)]|nr:glycosyltransferase family 2 protein [Candidatus Thiodiazotropha sp. (ex. Lucinisca nassula)]MBW9261698.1 glycosyltransferase family 2 protein [Candidatus Thiodiazotropha sp. (ex. Lucinisca nassula)]MBW9271183.1 glycosyltransferase family 2 protein [Candidatus Thiodiazotropha sp. (ex. Lucinisca nassula)]